MISTSSYNNCNTDKFRLVSISGDRGKGAGYEGECYPALAPKLGFWQVWHNNIDALSEEENNRYYIEEYYKQVLSKLDPTKVYKDLDFSILLCYEDEGEFCHRHIVAAWMSLLLGDSAPPIMEVEVDDFRIEHVSDSGEGVIDILEDVIKSNEDMKGLKSVRAWYLSNKADESLRMADKLEALYPGEKFDNYRRVAGFYKNEAIMVEREYRTLQKEK